MKIKSFKSVNSIKSGAAGNQTRKAEGVSGQVYDMSWMAEMAEQADSKYGTKMCSVTLTNMVRRTSGNIDTRSSYEKLMSKGAGCNFGFSVYFTVSNTMQLESAVANLENYLAYKLEQVAEGKQDQMKQSSDERIKGAIIKEAKRLLRNDNIEMSEGEWETWQQSENIKPAQVGINTLSLSVRCSTRDSELKKSDESTAWKIITMGGIDEEVAVFNSAGLKTIPLFDEDQVTIAKTVSEDVYKGLSQLENIWKSTKNIEAVTEKFCDLCNALPVPKDFRRSYVVFTDGERQEIQRRAAEVADKIRDSYN